MHYTLPYKTKQFFFVLIKLSIVVGAFYFIYNKLINNGVLDFSEFISYLTKNNVFSTKNVVLLLFLSCFNWCLEILKWKKLVSYIKKISFFEALQQSLGSLTASLLTPNRIGEYGAKAIYFIAPHRKRILLLNLIGNLTQMTITVIFGVIGLLFFIKRYPIEINPYKLSRLLVVVLIIFGLFYFVNKQGKFKIKGFDYEKIKRFIKEMPFKINGTILLFSTLRYIVFSFQFYFLLLLFGVPLSYAEAMIIITSMYLLASLIPTLFIFDVVIKGSVAVYLFSFVGVNELTILSIVTSMWLLNFVLPSVFGSYYVLNFEMDKQNDLL